MAGNEIFPQDGEEDLQERGLKLMGLVFSAPEELEGVTEADTSAIATEAAENVEVAKVLAAINKKFEMEQKVKRVKMEQVVAAQVS